MPEDVSNEAVLKNS